jgi:hypothetical protein
MIEGVTYSTQSVKLSERTSLCEAATLLWALEQPSAAIITGRLLRMLSMLMLVVGLLYVLCNRISF